MTAFLKFLEFLPAIAFFVSYKITADLILATAVIVASCIIGLGIQYTLTKTISRMQVFVTCAVIVFGLPTVLLKDPEIIKWKVTAVNVVLASLIFIFQNILKKNPIAYLLGKEISLPDHIWLKLGTAWMLFFVFAGMLNVVIAFYLPTLFGIDEMTAESLWVDYKTFGNAILNFIFALLSIAFLMKKHPEILNILKETNNKEK